MGGVTHQICAALFWFFVQFGLPSWHVELPAWLNWLLFFFSSVRSSGMNLPAGGQLQAAAAASHYRSAWVLDGKPRDNDSV